MVCWRPHATANWRRTVVARTGRWTARRGRAHLPATGGDGNQSGWDPYPPTPPQVQARLPGDRGCLAWIRMATEKDRQAH